MTTTSISETKLKKNSQIAVYLSAGIIVFSYAVWVWFNFIL